MERRAETVGTEGGANGRAPDADLALGGRLLFQRIQRNSITPAPVAENAASATPPTRLRTRAE